MKGKRQSAIDAGMATWQIDDMRHVLIEMMMKAGEGLIAGSQNARRISGPDA
jgi:hypothetical protein